MKFPCTLKNALLIIRNHFGLSFASKRIGLPCYTLFTITVVCSLQITLLLNNWLPTISVLAEITLLKTTCHFLLLLVGIDILTYRKDYDWPRILAGHQPPPLVPECASEGDAITPEDRRVRPGRRSPSRAERGVETPRRSRSPGRTETLAAREGEVVQLRQWCVW
jgi:hypothetical protein